MNPRFLIIRPDRIGDVVLSTHLPREIKKKYPDSFVAVMATSYTQAVFIGNPHIDEVITFPKQDEPLDIAYYFNFVSYIRKLNIDYAFMLLPNARINYMLFLSGIRTRVGVGHKFYQFITNTKSVYRRKYIPLRHESDYCADMLRKVKIEPEDLSPEIILSDTEQKEVYDNKKQLSPGGTEVIGINTTSGNSAPNMSSAEYRVLVGLILKDKRYSLAITDYDPPKEIDNIPGVHYPCKGKPLRESILSFASLDLLISASTGPMHIASALKVPTVSLFCPLIACSPLLWGPLGNNSSIILPDKSYCSNKCPGDPKKCNFSGEGGINATTVYKRINEFLNE